MGLLISIVGDESKPPLARALAAIQIKNCVDSRSQERSDEMAKRWLSLDPQLRQNVRNVLLAGLASQQRDVRRACSQGVAGVALVEVKRRLFVCFFAHV